MYSKLAAATLVSFVKPASSLAILGEVAGGVLTTVDQAAKGLIGKAKAGWAGGKAHSLSYQESGGHYHGATSGIKGKGLEIGASLSFHKNLGNQSYETAKSPTLYVPSQSGYTNAQISVELGYCNKCPSSYRDACRTCMRGTHAVIQTCKDKYPQEPEHTTVIVELGYCDACPPSNRRDCRTCMKKPNAIIQECKDRYPYVPIKPGCNDCYRPENETGSRQPADTKVYVPSKNKQGTYDGVDTKSSDSRLSGDSNDRATLQFDQRSPDNGSGELQSVASATGLDLTLLVAMLTVLWVMT